jgi:uncharacterized protein (DUF488 family)
MYYRRKILLSLIQHLEKPEKIKLQKMLFLFSELQLEPSYHFVPYKYGCFSFRANADIHTLRKYDILNEHNNRLSVNKKTDFRDQLKPFDREVLQKVVELYASLPINDLIRFTYTEYPYYAINSTIAKDILHEREYNSVIHSMPKNGCTALYTIGYEGISLEEYLNKLILNDVRILLDVRRNPLSMKYGFSKKQLLNSCKGIGIDYVHIPELGIDSAQRQNLENQIDYDKLFENYRNTTLKSGLDMRRRIIEYVEQYKRVALTCFEANVEQCHRYHLANSLISLKSWHYNIIHL